MSGSPEELVFISVHVSSSAAPTLTEFVEFSPSSVWSPLIADGQHGINLPVFFIIPTVSLSDPVDPRVTRRLRARSPGQDTRAGARARAHQDDRGQVKSRDVNGRQGRF